MSNPVPPSENEYGAAIAASYTMQSGYVVPQGMTLLAQSSPSEVTDGFSAAALRDAEGNVIIAFEGTQLSGGTYGNGTASADDQIANGQTPQALADAQAFAT